MNPKFSNEQRYKNLIKEELNREIYIQFEYRIFEYTRPVKAPIIKSKYHKTDEVRENLNI